MPALPLRDTVYVMSPECSRTMGAWPAIWRALKVVRVRFHRTAPTGALAITDRGRSILDVVVVGPGANPPNSEEIHREHRIFGAGGGFDSPDILRTVVRVRHSAVAALVGHSPPTGGVLTSIDRVARALIGKRNGLALSGGGVNSFFHAALIRALLQNGVPIDMISGTSGGSLVGAYYCALGEAGIDRLLGDRNKIFLSAFGAMFRQGPIASRVDRALTRDGAAIDVSSLEVPLIALALQLAERPFVCFMRHGSLGRAVELSGALPGFFAPVFDANKTPYMDGSVCDFVPVSTLLREGADHVLSSSVFPVPVRNGENTPWGRVHDLLDAVTILAVSGSRVPDFFEMVQASRLYGVNPALLAPIFPLGARLYERWLPEFPESEPFQSWLQEWRDTRVGAYQFPRPAH